MFTFDMSQIDPVLGSSPSNVRYLLQDTAAATAEFADEEIAAIFGARPADELPAVKVYRAAAQLASARARYYGRIPNVTDDRFALDVKSVRQGWESIAAECATLAQFVETGDVMQTIQGSRDPVWAADGHIIGGDGWLI